MSPSLLIVAAMLLSQTQVPVVGERIDIGEAVIFVPRDYKPRSNQVDLVFHLHGAPAVVEKALLETGWNAVLVEFNRKGLSSVYTEPFSDPTLFSRLLEKTLDVVRTRKLADPPRLGRVVVSSFSAGFGGVREILKVPADFDRVDALILADSLYCGYEGVPADRRLEDEKMAGFRRFAREAAAGRKSLLVTHSAQVPDGYASTTETADDLIRTVQGQPEPLRIDWGDGWVQSRRCHKGRFLVLGFEGSEGPDHLRHLREIARIWKATPDLFGQESTATRSP